MPNAVTVTGLSAAESRMRDRVKRMKDLGPVMRVTAARITKLTDDAFDKSRSPSGVAFPPLKESTILKRAPKSARKRKKSGGLTNAALKFRSQLLAPGGSKPLVNTARARNSQRARGTNKQVRWSAVGYLAPHITGGKGNRPPKRNPTVFTGKPGSFRLIKSVDAWFRRALSRYIETGRV